MAVLAGVDAKRITRRGGAGNGSERGAAVGADRPLNRGRAGVPVAAAVKVVLLPAATVWLLGWVVIETESTV